MKMLETDNTIAQCCFIYEYPKIQNINSNIVLDLFHYKYSSLTFYCFSKILQSCPSWKISFNFLKEYWSLNFTSDFIEYTQMQAELTGWPGIWLLTNVGPIPNVLLCHYPLLCFSSSATKYWHDCRQFLYEIVASVMTYWIL